MHILFIAPDFPAYQIHFVRALKECGAVVSGIGDRPAEQMSEQVKNHLDNYYQISNVTDSQALLECVQYIQSLGWVDRLEATIESHMLAAAKVREACSIPGMSYQQTWICRDKTAMKQFMQDKGIPCAAFTAVDTEEQVQQFINKNGFPVIIKPRDGAGASATWRCNSGDDLPAALADTGISQGKSAAIEEYIEGHEGFYDTLVAGGKIQHDFISHYYPNVLEAMRTRWISPYIIVTNRSELPDYHSLKDMGEKVIREIGLQNAPTHMEWFVADKGLKFSEIGARPPGVGQWDLYCAANDIDLYKEWASAVLYGQCNGHLSRRFCAAILSLRPNQEGKIHGYTGVEEVLQQYGDWIIDCHFPEPGTATQPINAGYMANAWIQIKYPDYDELRAILMDIANKITVYAG